MHFEKTKRKHTTLTLTDKMEILRRLDSGVSNSNLAAEYNVGRSTIYDIRKNRDKIEQFVNSAESRIGDRQTVRPGKYEEMEKTLYSWFLEERNKNTPLTPAILRQKAIFFYKKIYNTEGFSFKASDGWLIKFKKRYGIQMLTLTGENVLSDHSVVTQFIEKFQVTVDELRLSRDQVYNAVECGLFWRVLPNKLEIGTSKVKDKVTFMLCSNASGTHKLKLLLIGKFKNSMDFNNVRLPVVSKNHSKARVTKEIFINWFHNNFVPEVRKFLENVNLPQAALLVLDNTLGYDEFASNDGLIRILFSPPNVTPMDQRVIQTININYKKKILVDVIRREKTISTSLKDAMFTLTETWNNVPQNLISASWKKLWPPIKEEIKEEESENVTSLLELIHTVTQNENIEFTGNEIEEWFTEDANQYNVMRTEVELTKEDCTNEEFLEDKNDIVKLEDPNQCSEMMTKTEIMKEDFLEDKNDFMSSTATVKAEDALAAIDTSIRWAEENYTEDDTLLTLRKMREDILLKMYNSKQQTIIDNVPG